MSYASFFSDPPYILRFGRFIHSKNRAGLTYKLAPNHMTDRTSDEIRYMRGKLRSNGFNGGSTFHYTKSDVENLPEQMDWRLYGAVTPVKGNFSFRLNSILV